MKDDKILKITNKTVDGVAIEKTWKNEKINQIKMLFSDGTCLKIQPRSEILGMGFHEMFLDFEIKKTKTILKDKLNEK